MTNDEQPARRDNYLRAWREFRGLTQAELAAVVGTQGSLISLLESGDRELSDKWLRRLAPALQVTPGLLGFSPEDIDRTMLDALGLSAFSKSTASSRTGSFRASRSYADVAPDPQVDPGYDIPELWWQIPDEDKPAALAALKALIPRH